MRYDGAIPLRAEHTRPTDPRLPRGLHELVFNIPFATLDEAPTGPAAILVWTTPSAPITGRGPDDPEEGSGA
ncbi:hypothetical protein CcI49_06075 [Frankia sp. CcI49]|nr:hypothetical protein ACG83_20350 [Frankia sp. R43]ONH61738.1 hypothetical protein CcI49_06075 [Frankia sp. CcI49]